jgi:hypothetical protein
MLSLGCVATGVPQLFSIVINKLQAKKCVRIRNSGFYPCEYSKFGRNINSIVVREENWEDPRVGQTSESASGSALKSMTQRLCCAEDPVGLSTSWLPPRGAAPPHSVDPVFSALHCDALDPAFPA